MVKMAPFPVVRLRSLLASGRLGVLLGFAGGGFVPATEMKQIISRSRARVFVRGQLLARRFVNEPLSLGHSRGR